MKRPRSSSSKDRGHSDETSRPSLAQRAPQKRTPARPSEAKEHPGYSENGVTLRDIAKKLGISHVSVSLALRGAPEISESRRRQIQALAEKMGYRPNPFATALGQRRSAKPSQHAARGLAWINYLTDPRQLLRNKEFSLYWKGASATAQQHGYHLEEMVCNPKLTPDQLYCELKERNISGILVPSVAALPKYWESSPWRDFSIVLLGFSARQAKIPLVADDQTSNCVLAFETIRSLGYPRVGFITYRLARTRFTAGFLTGQQSVPEQQRIPIHYLTGQTDGIVERLRVDQWIESHHPDAVLTEVAIVPQLLRSTSHRVPSDIGLATLNTLTGDGLAGIDPKPEAIGSAAVEMLILQMNPSSLNTPKTYRELLIGGEWCHGPSLPLRNQPPRTH